MTDGMQAPLDEIRALVAERTRYDGWMEALAGRRAATPAHVFERVSRDYEARRQRVADALAAHVGMLREREGALALRHGELTRTLDERRDALAEVELRTLVGEYAAEDGERLRQEAAAAVQELERETAALGGSLDEVRTLLGQVGIPTAQTVAPEPEAIESPRPMHQPGDADGRAYAGDVSSGHHYAPPAEHAPAPVAEVAVQEPPKRPTPPYAGQLMAEAALHASRLAPGAPDAPPTPTGEKTLRCQDCGAMNYPTEWYCEHCGGELAAL